MDDGPITNDTREVAEQVPALADFLKTDQEPLAEEQQILRAYERYSEQVREDAHRATEQLAERMLSDH